MPTEKWKPNDAQREVLEGLRAEAAKEKSQADFARDYLNMSESRFSKTLAALDEDPERRSYFDEIQNPDAVMETLSAALAKVSVRRTREAELKGLKLLKLSRHELVIKALNKCIRKASCERLVVFRAPTGGGKSMLCSRLEREMDARIVHTRHGWRKSYFTVLQDLAEALGLNFGGECRISIMEDAIIAHCRLNPLVLAIDEGEYFGEDALNGIKLLLNKTQITVLICVIPEAHDRWSRKFSLAAKQLERRQHAWIEQAAVDEADAALFFPQFQFAEPGAALKQIAAAASSFGHFSLIATVAEKLEGKNRVEETEVKKAIASALRRMRKSMGDEQA